MCLRDLQSKFMLPTKARVESTTKNLAWTMPEPWTADHSMMRNSRFAMALSRAMPPREFFSNFFSRRKRIFTPRLAARSRARSEASSGSPVEGVM